MKCNLNHNQKEKGDPRLREIVEQYDRYKIGLDDSFRFHCTMCGKCCVNREDILLTPKDLFNIAKELGLTPVEVLEQYCETYIGDTSRIPLIRLKPRGEIKRCPLLKDHKCSVHKCKPVVCANLRTDSIPKKSPPPMWIIFLWTRIAEIDRKRIR